MRTAQFVVSPEIIGEFAEAMAARDLDNKISDTTEDGELVIEVTYEREETEAVDELEEVLETLNASMEGKGEEAEDHD